MAERLQATVVRRNDTIRRDYVLMMNDVIRICERAAEDGSTNVSVHPTDWCASDGTFHESLFIEMVKETLPGVSVTPAPGYVKDTDILIDWSGAKS